MWTSCALVQSETYDTLTMKSGASQRGVRTQRQVFIVILKKSGTLSLLTLVLI